MNPSQVSSELRRIATAINNSQNPSRERVLSDLRQVLASMDETAGMEIEAAMDHEAMGMADLKKMIKNMGLAVGLCTMIGCKPTDKRSEEAIMMAMEHCLRSDDRDFGSPVTTQQLQECSDMIESKLKYKGLTDGTTGATVEFDPANGMLEASKNGKTVKVLVDSMR